MQSGTPAWLVSTLTIIREGFTPLLIVVSSFLYCVSASTLKGHSGKREKIDEADKRI